ncbi:MAG TPA: transcriptional regulator [Actinokineospora sp.]|nr:transcriptional regulator [Actinokineospora sp.]
MTPHHALRPATARPWPVRATIGLARGFGRLLQGLGGTALLGGLVVGIPWGLIHYIGWPLPDHLPTWDQVQITLLNPMSTQFLLSALACALWPIWARFIWDVALAGVDAARLAHWPEIPAGPLRTAAGVLVGAVVFSVLGQRAAMSAPSASAGDRPDAGLAAAAPLVPGPSVRPVAFAIQLPHAAPPADQVAAPGTAVVLPPSSGVYDSLWRIAQRELGDGTRWPEIWELNRGHTQTDGRIFRDPNHIRPGWTLRLPIPQAVPQASDPVAGEQRRGQPAAPTSPTTVPPPTTRSTVAAPTDAPPPTTESAPTMPVPPPLADPDAVPRAGGHPGTSITVDTGAFVGLALAALVTAALVTVRLRRRRLYRPGSGVRDEHTIAPIVRSLRIAYDRATLPRDENGAPIQPDPPTASCPSEVALRDRASATADALLPKDATTVVGVHDGRPIALDLARTRGLGLVGPGAAQAVRALVVSLIAASRHDDVQLVVPAADLPTLIGDPAPPRLPGGLRVVDDLDAALDVLEAELLARARRGTTPPSPAVLVANPSPHADRRVQAILDNGSTQGIVGVLIGQWRPGGTAHVRADGTVSATSSDLAELTGTRLFTLPADDARGLLDLLTKATPHPVTPRGRDGGATIISLEERQWAARASDPDQVEILSYPTDSIERPPAPSPTMTASPRVHIDIPSTAAAMVPCRTAPVDLDWAGARARPKHAETTESRQHPPLELVVLGRPHLHHHGPDGSVDIIDAIAPRQREVLVYLALHPGGARRETLAATIWPDAPGDRPYNSFHATLSQLRRALRDELGDVIGDLIVNADGHYSLNPDTVTVDLWKLDHALRAASNRGDDQDALRTITGLHNGELGDGLTSGWLDAPRECLRRDVLDTLGSLVSPAGSCDSTETLAVLEHIRGIDPHNESVYVAIVRAQAHAGHHQAISRTVALLTSALAEIDAKPSPDTLTLIGRLRERQRPT